MQYSSTPSHSAWSGFAFERVCLLHSTQIKQGLGIAGVLTEISAWQSRETDLGAQIDLVIDRNDRVINLCEAKFSSEKYAIDKKIDGDLRNKRAVFKQETKTRKTLQTTLITPYGLVQNAYANQITSQLTMDDLFRQ